VESEESVKNNNLNPTYDPSLSFIPFSLDLDSKEITVVIGGLDEEYRVDATVQFRVVCNLSVFTPNDFTTRRDQSQF